MPPTPNHRAGRAELRAALAGSQRLFLGVAVFSFFVNLLMLTGPALHAADLRPGC
ncbi:MAG: hypothetical protein KatS3mg118_2208 [Paracoccaceae bacterium]|nr:MAG: hypothetical protein KatS3mg118_2208 [Paracoccaceae bacterium]